VHLFDLMRSFAGDPLWCSARVLQNGQEITLADAHPATEGISGLLPGMSCCAIFLPRRSPATFTSGQRIVNSRALGLAGWYEAKGRSKS